MISRIPLWRLPYELLLVLVSSRGLVWQLARRDLVGTYKRSFLGLLWLLISPLLGLLSWLLLNVSGILRPGDTGIPYPFFVLIGLNLWSAFISSYHSAAGSLASGSSLLLQVRFPHETLFLKQVLVSFLHFLIHASFTLVLMLIFGCPVTLWIILLPLLAMPLVLWGSGIGLVVSVTSAVVPETKAISDVVVNAIFFLSPVVYAAGGAHPVLRSVIGYNPLTELISTARVAVTTGPLELSNVWLLGFAGGVIMFALSLHVFRACREWVLEKI